MTVHSLTPTRETLHGTFSSKRDPVLTIDSGDTIEATTLDARWGIEVPTSDDAPGAMFADRDPVKDAGHALCGPIAIRGAEPGMTLAIEIDGLTPGSWGWNVAGGRENGINERLGFGTEQELYVPWTVDPDSGTATNTFGHTVRIAPFFGVLGMPDDTGDLLPTAPPRPTGGNIDCKELVSGTTLYLPIAVEGGLLSVGDGHAAQGDGEISGTAIECPMASSRLTLSLRDDLSLNTPIARTADAWITFGFDESLDEAMLIAMDAMLDLMGREHGVNRHQAMALASVVVDLRVTQAVNGVRGIHAVLRDNAVTFG